MTKPEKVANKLTENVIDFMLLEHFRDNHAFQSWFAERVGLTGWDIVESMNSTWHAKREVDLRLCLSRSGRQAVVLIENKIRSPFSIGQITGYEKRRDHESSKGADVVVSCLIAPENYPGRHPEAGDFDRFVSYEDMRSFLTGILGEKGRWLDQVLGQAIDRGPKPRQRVDCTRPFASNARHVVEGRQICAGMRIKTIEEDGRYLSRWRDIILRFSHPQLVLDKVERVSLSNQELIDENGRLTNHGQDVFLQQLEYARKEGHPLPRPPHVERGRRIHPVVLSKAKERADERAYSSRKVKWPYNRMAA